MTDAVTLDGTEYVSSKRASQLTGYTQDYIGQIARGGKIDARRVSGLWYVSMDSLTKYKEIAEAHKPEPPSRGPSADPDSLITFDGKDYISASRASKVTGYNQDYVGQLARSGSILSRQVGNRWYVEREGILAHKKEKDALLAVVQSAAVGIQKTPAPTRISVQDEHLANSRDPFFTYSKDTGDLLPLHQDIEVNEPPKLHVAQPGTKWTTQAPSGDGRARPTPIRVVNVYATSEDAVSERTGKRSAVQVGKSRQYTTYFTVAGIFILVIALVVAIRVLLPRTQPVYSNNIEEYISSVFGSVGDVVESAVTSKLNYERQ